MGLVKNGGDKSTRFGTNRVAADKREMENLFFLVVYEDSWSFFEDFWRIWFVVRRF